MRAVVKAAKLEETPAIDLRKADWIDQLIGQPRCTQEALKRILAKQGLTTGQANKKLMVQALHDHVSS